MTTQTPKPTEPGATVDDFDKLPMMAVSDVRPDVDGAWLEVRTGTLRARVRVPLEATELVNERRARAAEAGE